MTHDRDDHGTGALSAIAEHLDPPVIVMTTTDGVDRAGCLIGFHTQCSIEPDRYAIWLSKANHTYRVALFADHVALHLLSTDDHDLAELFGGTSGDQVDKFARCAWTVGTGGVPLLDRLPNRIVGRRLAVYEESDSDHVCMMLAPEVVQTTQPFEPLRVSAVADINAGHPAQDRPAPPSMSPAG